MDIFERKRAEIYSRGEGVYDGKIIYIYIYIYIYIEREREREREREIES